MAEKVRRTFRVVLSGLRYITLVPPRRRPRVRRDPSRYWYRAGVRLSDAVREYGRAVAQ